MSVTLNVQGKMHFVSFKGNAVFMDTETLLVFLHEFGQTIVNNEVVDIQ